MGVGPYESLDACVIDQATRYDDADVARRVCGEIESRSMTEGWVLTEAELGSIEKVLGVERKPNPGDFDSAIVALYVPEDDARALAIPGGVEPAQMHITLAYLGTAGDAKTKAQDLAWALMPTVAYLAPITLKVAGVGRFVGVSEGKDAVYASVDSPALEGLRQHLVDGGLSEYISPSAHGFTPHITLAYVASDAPMPIETIEPREIRIERVTLALGDERLEFPLRRVETEPASLAAGDVSTEAELTAADDAGIEWDVCIIRPGPSIKGVNWTAGAIAAAAPMYERIPVGINGYEDHEEDRVRILGDLSDRAKRRIVGWIEQVALAADGALRGRLKMLPKGTEELRAAMVRTYRAGRAPGLSHVVRVGPWTESRVAGRQVIDVSRIEQARFVDIVLNPSAGGAMTTLVAGDLNDASKSSPTGESTVTEPTKTPETPATPPAAPNVAAVATPPAPPATPPAAPNVAAVATPPAPEVLTEAVSPSEFRKLQERVERSDATAMLERKLGAIDFPAPVKTALREKYTGMGRIFTESEVDADLKAQRTILDSVFSPRPGGAARIEGGAGAYDRVSDEMTESLFGVRTERDDKGKIKSLKMLGASIATAPLRRDSSIRQWYNKLTGDFDLSGKVVGGLLTESITTATFAEIFGDSVTRAFQAQAAQLNLESYRTWANIVPAKDFRTNRRVRFGGYGNLPAVAQGGTYNALTTPGDEEATYAISKRGGTEDLTLEAVANDDLGVVRRIPQGLARSAMQTRHEFVYDFLANNSAVTYDATALAHANHNNTGTTALGAAALIAAINRMRKQTDMSSTKKLGIRPRYLVVPIDLSQVAYELTATEKVPASANNDANFIRTFQLQTIVVEYWTDANNWWLVADPSDVPTLELAFFNGNETPEMFLQDMPTVGNVFNADKLTWKIRDIFGAAVLDHRAFDGNIVA